MQHPLIEIFCPFLITVLQYCLRIQIGENSTLLNFQIFIIDHKEKKIFQLKNPYLVTMKFNKFIILEQ